jgi:hypothetical protein
MITTQLLSCLTTDIGKAKAFDRLRAGEAASVRGELVEPQLGADAKFPRIANDT